ncbi:MAG: RDD family protein [Pseudomonas sp.]
MAVKLLYPNDDFPAPGIARRVASAFYDLMLCLALVMVLTMAYQQGALRLIYGPEALQAMAEAGQLDRDPLLSVMMILAIYGFFGLFWTLRGQTLGMQAWRMRVQQPDGTSITWRQAINRVSFSLIGWLCGGLGIWWSLWDKQSRTWADIFSGTRTVVLPKR